MAKNVILTGANRGIGKVMVGRLAEQGYNVWACARNQNDEFELYLRHLEEKFNVILKPIYFDLTDTDDIKRGFKEICNDNRDIDVLINNAGLGHMALFQMTSISKIREIYEVNLFAPMVLSQLVIRKMCRQHSGKILNVASTAAKEIYIGNCIYGASKAALIAFTQSLAAEVAGYGIIVNAIAPGLTDTEMSSIFEADNPEVPLKRTALGRKIKPDEIADVVITLLSDKMNIINGQVICINGGSK